MDAVRLDQPGPLRRTAELGKAAFVFVRQIVSRRYRWPGYGGPFNGQAIRARTADFLSREYSPDAWIETGTFLGFTTRYLAGHGVPVYSVELDPAHYRLAKRALRRLPNVTLICGDSADALRRLAEGSAVRRPLVYLDAHWGSRLPLPEELECAFGSWPDLIVIIDDFLVPHDADYRYETCAGIPLRLENLTLPEGTSVAFPAAPAQEETGARSGAVYLGRGPSAREALAGAIRAGVLVEDAAA